MTFPGTYSHCRGSQRWTCHGCSRWRVAAWTWVAPVHRTHTQVAAGAGGGGEGGAGEGRRPALPPTSWVTVAGSLSLWACFCICKM